MIKVQIKLLYHKHLNNNINRYSRSVNVHSAILSQYNK